MPLQRPFQRAPVAPYRCVLPTHSAEDRKRKKKEERRRHKKEEMKSEVEIIRMPLQRPFQRAPVAPYRCVLPTHSAEERRKKKEEMKNEE
jgi:hypothetical protein